MFWNLILEPGKKYSSEVKESFHLSMAALDVKTVKNDDIFPVLVEIDGQELLLCNLCKPNYLQCNLDLVFERGTKLTFMSSGKATIHLTGYVIQEDDDQLFNDSDESDESEDESIPSKGNQEASKGNTKGQESKSKKESSPEKRKVDMDVKFGQKKPKLDLMNSSDDDSDDADSDTSEEGDDSGSEDDLDDNSKFTFSDDDMGEEGDDDSDVEEEEDDDDDDDEDEDDSDSDDSSAEENVKPKMQTPKPSKNQPQKTPVQEKKTPAQDKKTPKTPISNKKQELGKQMNGMTPKSEKKDKKNKNTPKSENKGKGDATPGSPQIKKHVLEGGVIAEDLKSGNGPVAKPGRMISVLYTGRLKSNNRVFDQTKQNFPFKFRLGRSEVIKGWDVGLNGMKVGSKRKITIPASMAYGSKGSPPMIPPNSALVFEVELKSVS